jgi:AcrR family transcriptional regulator
VRKRRERTSQDADRTLATVIKAATSLFVSRGYADTSIRAVAVRARMTSGAIYHHFRDKRDLFRAVAEDVTRRMVAGAMEAVNAEPDPWRKLWRGIEAILVWSTVPEVKLVFLEAPLVVGIAEWRALENANTSPLLYSVLGDLVAKGAMRPERAQLVGRLVRAAVIEAAMAVAEAKDPDAVREQAGGMLQGLLQRLASVA